MDEPTNDLDIESLELLEDTLQGYEGTLLLVSHDRRFLDNVVTQTLVAEGDGRWREYVGGYSDWLQQRPAPVAAAPTQKAARAVVSRTPTAAQPAAARRLSARERRELEELPARIEALEAEQHALNARISAPDYHRQDVAAIKADRARVTELEHLLAAAFERWAELDALA